jgi:hypothetical protein
VLVDDAYGGIQQHQGGENPQLQEYQTKARRKIPKERQKTAVCPIALYIPFNIPTFSLPFFCWSLQVLSTIWFYLISMN